MPEEAMDEPVVIHLYAIDIVLKGGGEVSEDSYSDEAYRPGYIWQDQLWGDCNHNGRLTTLDALLVLEMVNSGSLRYDPLCDITRDGDIGLDDVVGIMDRAWTGIVAEASSFIDVNPPEDNEQDGGDVVQKVRHEPSPSIVPSRRTARSITTTTTPSSPSCSTYVKPVISTGVLSICRPGQTLCKSGCVNLLTDTANCGSCGVVCGLHEACVKGDCACSKGYTHCKTGCANLLTDAANCGTCGKVCGSHEACVNGDCVCSKGYTLCKTGCVNLQTDAANCGVCGKACGSHETCVNGECICSKGYTLCKSGCANLLTDAANCGTCGKICPSGQKCVNGACSGGLVKSIS